MDIDNNGVSPLRSSAVPRITVNRRAVQALCTGLILCTAPGAPRAAEAAVDSGGTQLDRVFMADARRSAYHGHYSEAIAKMTAVATQSPNFADAYYVRAIYERDAGRFTEASADLDRAQTFHPDAYEIRLLRATIALRQHNGQAALAYLDEAAKLPPQTLWKHARDEFTVHTMSFALAFTSIAQQLLGHNEAALEAFKHELDFESERPWYVLGTHCYYAAAAGLLDMAELTCSEAIARQNRYLGDYDSLGLAHVKMGKWSAAIQDYNQSLSGRPDLTLSLYGRGIAKLASGDVAGGNADIAAAKQGEPDIVNIMATLGVKPG
jgi:tetratricopeptide (TPR) repeat protein